MQKYFSSFIILILSLCVCVQYVCWCVWVSVFLFVNSCACSSWHTCGGQRTPSNASGSHLPSLRKEPLVWFRFLYHCTPGCLAAEHPGTLSPSPISPQRCWNYRRVLQHITYIVLGIQTWNFMLAWQILHPLSQLWSPHLSLSSICVFSSKISLF